MARIVCAHVTIVLARQFHVIMNVPVSQFGIVHCASNMLQVHSLWLLMLAAVVGELCGTIRIITITIIVHIHHVAKFHLLLPWARE